MKFLRKKYSLRFILLLVVLSFITFQYLFYLQVKKPHFFFNSKGLVDYTHYKHVSKNLNGNGDLLKNWIISSNREHLPEGDVLFRERFGEHFHTYWYFISSQFRFEDYGSGRGGEGGSKQHYNYYKVIENFCTADNFKTITLHLDDCSLLSTWTSEHEIPLDYGWLYGHKYLLFNRDVVWWGDSVTKQKCKKATRDNKPRDMCIFKGNTVFTAQTFNVSTTHLVHFVEDVLKIPSIARNHEIDHFMGTRELGKNSRNGWQYGAIFSAMGKPVNVMTIDDFRGVVLNGCSDICFERGFFPNLKFQFFTNHQDAVDFKTNARRLCGLRPFKDEEMESDRKRRGGGPRISLVNRKMGSRRIGNYRQLLALDASISYYEDFPESFCEQVELLSNTDILIHPHGAGLINIAFMKQFSVVIEVYPQFIYKPCFKTMSYAVKLNHLDFLISDPNVKEFDITKESQREKGESHIVRSVKDCHDNRDVCNLKILLHKEDLVVDPDKFSKYLEYARGIVGSRRWWKDNKWCLELFDPTPSEFALYKDHFERWWINNGENLYPCLQPVTDERINSFDL